MTVPAQWEIPAAGAMPAAGVLVDAEAPLLLSLDESIEIAAAVILSEPWTVGSFLEKCANDALKNCQVADPWRCEPLSSGRVFTFCGCVSDIRKLITENPHNAFHGFMLSLSETRHPRSCGKAPDAAVISDVVIAVIDDSFALTHAAFDGENSESRIAAAWLQGVAPRCFGSASPFSGGTVLLREDIGLLSAASLGDDKRAACLTGQTDFATSAANPLESRLSHGTHVAALAAAGHESDLVLIQLPDDVSRDYSGGRMEVPLIEAMAFTFALAALSGSKPPAIVFNLSYGNHDSPARDGGLCARAIDEMLAHWNASFPASTATMMVASGNSHQAGCHGELDIREPAEFGVIVLPDDRTITKLDILMSGEADVIVQPPGKLAPFTAGRCNPGALMRDKRGRVVARVDMLSRGPSESIVRLVIGPSADPAQPALVAASRLLAGTWRFTIRPHHGAVKVDLCVGRDEAGRGGQPGGRQASLTDLGTGQLIIGKNTTNALARARHVVAVGAFDPSSGKATVYSSGDGLDKDGCPVCVAPAERNPFHRGVLSAGSMSGTRVAMNGTSAAAPQITRVIARKWLTAAASRQGFATPRDILASQAEALPEPARTGYGLVSAVDLSC